MMNLQMPRLVQKVIESWELHGTPCRNIRLHSKQTRDVNSKNNVILYNVQKYKKRFGSKASGLRKSSLAQRSSYSANLQKQGSLSSNHMQKSAIFGQVSEDHFNNKHRAKGSEVEENRNS